MLVRCRDIFHDWFELTDRQADVLLFIYEYRDKHGYSPALREIAKRFRMASSASGPMSVIRPLVKKGALRRDEYAARTMVPTFRFIPASELN